jgi:hypothetical protein
MATNPSELYAVIAQMAVGFAGFGSLASRLGQRQGGDDAKVDAMRLALMLSASLSAALLGLLPATLAGFALDEGVAVRASAVVALVAMLTYAPISVRRARNIRHVHGFSKGGILANSLCSLLAFAAFLLCSLNLPVGRIAALYLLGLVGLLCSSVIMFSRVIASMLRPHNEGQER